MNYYLTTQIWVRGSRGQRKMLIGRRVWVGWNYFLAGEIVYGDDIDSL